MKAQTANRVAAGLALTAALLIVWLNAAAGLIGIEDDDPANLLYVGVLAIGFVGAMIARFRPRGLARVFFVTALALAVVGAIALQLPNTASPWQIVLLHAVLVAMFVGSALLLRRTSKIVDRAEAFCFDPSPCHPTYAAYFNWCPRFTFITRVFTRRQ